jgi:hypothetical protein
VAQSCVVDAHKSKEASGVPTHRRNGVFTPYSFQQEFADGKYRMRKPFESALETMRRLEAEFLATSAKMRDFQAKTELHRKQMRSKISARRKR